MNIGLIGSGNLGRYLLKALNMQQTLPGFSITSILDEREHARKKLAELSKTYHCEAYFDLGTFLHSPVDLVVECATVDAVYHYAPKILQKKDMIVVSIGALVDHTFFNKLAEITKMNKTKLYLPASAIGGLDVNQAANITGGLESVTLLTRKPAQALGTNTDEETVLFEGTAKEAIQRFPKNINVAITLSLAGLGVEKTMVRIIADPKVKQNIHTIQAIGDFGKMEISLQNHPLPSNPKTSYLTALSILKSCWSLNESVDIG